MTNNDDGQQLPANDFRARRAYLPDQAFGLVTGPAWGPPTDLIPEESWQELINLPTDVLLRTTDRRGTRLAQMNNLWTIWMKSLPGEVETAPFIFNAGWDAADDFNVSVFVTAHGYYRQGLGNLRNALEGMAIAATFAASQDEQALGRWLKGKRVEMKPAALRPSLGSDITSVLGRLYGELSSYVHPQQNGTNAFLWNGSNGPVWENDAFDLVYRAFRDVMGMCLVLLRTGWSGYSIPRKLLLVFDTPGGAWTPAALGALKARR
jgi:hypothetical protein